MPSWSRVTILLLAVCTFINIVNSAESDVHEDSANLTCPNPNEIVYSCGACDATCASPTRTCSLLCREQAECGCDKGHVRNKQAICIPLEDCNLPKLDCKDVYCESGWVCKDGDCVIGSADNSSCASITCAANSTCLDGSCVSAISAPANCPMYAIAAAPERCAYKEETNTHGCKIPVLTCQFLKCTDNEEPKFAELVMSSAAVNPAHPTKHVKNQNVAVNLAFSGI
uniref:TIL domain-containing protein n=1 Tax=Ditylenchus dipsaci TaxID=166011 RepID=A0A915DVF7_9BILA